MLLALLALLPIILKYKNIYNNICNYIHIHALPNYSLAQYGSYGSYLSGILGVALIYLGYRTITEQSKLNQRQKIESTFMTMLEIVRQNSDNIYSKGKTGRYVFVLINEEFNQLVDIFYHKLLSIPGNDRKKVINIIWVIVFYGLSEEIWPFLEIKLNTINEEILKDNDFFAEIKKLRDDHSATLKNNNKIKNRDRKSAKPQYLQWLKFDGYQNQLGHYYQHLYQTITYIDTRKILSYDDKKEYIKTVRAQLSVYELIVFYYNTLSDLGKAWEGSKDENLRLVTKYRLLKNIPLTYKAGTIEMKPEEDYPETLFTGQEDDSDRDSGKRIKEREELEKRYS